MYFKKSFEKYKIIFGRIIINTHKCALKKAQFSI